MEVPLQITFRDMEPSPWVEDRVREEVRKLEQFYDRITSCRVVVETPHRHHLRGNQIRAHIELDVPGSVLVVDHEPSLHHTLSQAGATHWEKHCEAHPEHKDAFLAIHQSFGQARRQLQEYMAANPRGKYGRVVYDMRRDFGIDPDELRKRFDFYFERFPIRAERG